MVACELVLLELYGMYLHLLGRVSRRLISTWILMGSGYLNETLRVIWLYDTFRAVYAVSGRTIKAKPANDLRVTDGRLYALQYANIYPPTADMHK